MVATAIQVASARDQNPIVGDLSFYGVIEKIWLLDYTAFNVPSFKCNWVNSNDGVKFDELCFILVDLKSKGHKDDPFILASQVKQVFYVQDPENQRMSCVIGNSHGNFNDTDEGNLMNLPFPANPVNLEEPTILIDNDDEAAYVREDGEPLYID